MWLFPGSVQQSRESDRHVRRKQLYSRLYMSNILAIRTLFLFELGNLTTTDPGASPTSCPYCMVQCRILPKAPDPAPMSSTSMSVMMGDAVPPPTASSACRIQPMVGAAPCAGIGGRAVSFGVMSSLHSLSFRPFRKDSGQK